MESTVLGRENRSGLSSFALKIIACVFMTFDHIGYYLFPNAAFLRIVGRLAFPIFAFFIAEGCRYTKSPKIRVLRMLGFGLVFEAAAYIYIGTFYGNIFLVFSLSCLLIFSLKELKRKLFSQGKAIIKLLFITAFAAETAVVYFLSIFIRFDYGFFGIITPLLVSIFDSYDLPALRKIEKINILPVRLFLLSAGLLCVCMFGKGGNIQWFSFFSIAFLMLYNGKRGFSGGKYFFYVFYPLHIVIIVLISEFLF